MAKEKAKKVKQENALVRYLRETMAELRKIHWPSRQEAWSLAKVVMAVTVGMAIFLGALDLLFAEELKGLMAGNAVAIGVVVVAAVAGVLAVVILRRQAAR